MWDNYYDVVNYKKKSSKLDKSGHTVFDRNESINVRQVSGGEEQIINVNGNAVKYTKEYQIPFMIAEGDLINDRNVVYAEPSKDVFGKFQFCIAKVE